ncbi:MAG TPA: hypothetical protein PKZ53_26850, partial [Acidobacteriota bacterium]|nr:hypothetical protein [Acidobacteriota bacterium]
MRDQFQLKQSVVSAGPRRAWIFVLMVMFFNCLALVGQQESGSVRDIKRTYSNFDQLRPKATSKNQFSAKKSESFSKSVPKSLPTNLSASDQYLVGITLWKLRPQGMGDPKPEVPI